MEQALYIYNIFPRVYRNTNKWRDCVKRAKYMGFNTIFVNSFFKCGSSNSIYSITDYYAFDKLSFQKGCNPEKEIINFNNYCKKENMYTLVDLVINHTAPDSPLIKSHPNWFKFRPNGKALQAGTPSDSGYTVWYDTAKLQYRKDDKNGLKKYMLDVCKYYLSLGFSGFRCDSANFVDIDVWYYIIGEIRKIKPDAIFIGESFMCPPKVMIEMGNAGFDYVFNSSKWWNYEGDWLLDQYNAIKNNVSTISFPENHDTERLIKTCNFDCNLFWQRVFFTALFSKSFYITDGLEFACSKKFDVAKTRPNDLEHTKMNYMDDIKKLLEIKSKYKPLHEESETEILHNDHKYICIKKSYNDESVLILINKTKTDLKIKLKKDKLIKKNEYINTRWKRSIKMLPMGTLVVEIKNK